MDAIMSYFPRLNDLQQQQFSRLGPLYRAWNDKINVVSRKDIDNIYPHHILHALAIAKFIRFASGARVLDLGTGGGLPGIPLAILFPETHFTLIDGTRKKITVVNEIVSSLGLTNVQGRHIRAEELRENFDFVVCRAVARIDKLVAWSFPIIKKLDRHAIPNGLITLKGGQLEDEMESLPPGSYYDIVPIQPFFEDPYFEEKFIVYVQK